MLPKPTIIPSLAYDDAPAAIDWLERVFGFKRRLIIPGPDGTILHSEVSIGDAVIMVFSSRPEEGQISPKTAKVVTQSLCVLIDDPDAHHEKAKAEGAAITAEPKDEEFGARSYGAMDLEGHQWYFTDYDVGTHWTE